MATKKEVPNVEQNAPLQDAQAENQDAPKETEDKDTPPLDDRTQEQIEADELQAAKDLLAKQKSDAAKAEADKKIAEANVRLVAAKKDRDKWNSLDMENPDEKEYHDFQIAKNPNWLADKEQRVKDIEAEIADLKLSMLTPEEKAAQTKWNEAKETFEAAQKAYEGVKAEILATFPDFFGTAKSKVSATQKAPKTATDTTTTTGEIKPFKGKLLSNEEASNRIMDLHNAGTTSESEIIRAIYGNDFTISGQKGIDIGNGNPRSQIHTLRDKLGLIPNRA